MDPCSSTSSCLPTPPGSTHGTKPSCVRRPHGTRISWTESQQYYSSTDFLSSEYVPSADRNPPTRSILKKTASPSLPLLDDSRPVTPEPEEPLGDLNYLDYPVSRILDPSSPLRGLIEAYSILAARLRTAVADDADPNCSWPLFQPLRKNTEALVDALVRDLRRVLIDPLDDGSVAGPSTRSQPPPLPSPEKSPKKRTGMTEEQVKYARDLCVTTHSAIKFLLVAFSLPAVCGVFSHSQLSSIFTTVLSIPLKDHLPTPNARKTWALSICLIQVQRLPEEVLRPMASRITYALRRAIDGELGKEGKKGSASDGLRAIHELSLYLPSIFVKAFAELLGSILDCLLGRTVPIRALAAHALGGLAYASTRIPNSIIHTRLHDEIEAFLTTSASPSGSPTRSSDDAPIIITLRTTLKANDPPVVVHGPVWALSVLASFSVLLAGGIAMSPRLLHVIQTILGLGLRHSRPAVRALACAVWRVLVHSWHRPPLLETDVDESYEQDLFKISPQEHEIRDNTWKAIRAVVELGTGVALVGAVLASRYDDGPERTMLRVKSVLWYMSRKSTHAACDAVDLVARLVADPDNAEGSTEWDNGLLLAPALFMPSHGLFAVDIASLGAEMRSWNERSPVPADVRPLRDDELVVPDALDCLISVWLTGLATVVMESGMPFPEELRDGWRGIVRRGISALQAEAEDPDERIAAFCETLVDALKSILYDQEINLVSFPTPDADNTAPPFRSNEAVKLALTRELWGIAHPAIPDIARPAAARTLANFLLSQEQRLVPPTDADADADARVEWAAIVAETLALCPEDVFDAFWAARTWRWGASRVARAAVWRAFVERWVEVVPGNYGMLQRLLAVPFAERRGWEMGPEDLTVWEGLLTTCVDRALDEGVDTSCSVLEGVAACIAPASGSSASLRAADILLSMLDCEALDGDALPLQLFELVSDVLIGAYPPEQGANVVCMWLLRTVSKAIDECPRSLVLDVLRVMGEGIAVWIADAEMVFTVEEYALDPASLFEYIMVAGHSLDPTMQTLDVLMPVITAAFVGRPDKPPSVAQSFHEMWAETFAKEPAPADGWPRAVLRLLPGYVQPEEEQMSVDLPLPAKQATIEVIDLDAVPAGIEVIDVDALPDVSPRASAPRTPPRPVFSLPPSSSAQNIPRLPRRTPRTPCRLPIKDKENASPLAPKPLPSVVEHIALLGKRRADDDDLPPAKRSRPDANISPQRLRAPQQVVEDAIDAVAVEMLLAAHLQEGSQPSPRNAPLKPKAQAVSARSFYQKAPPARAPAPPSRHRISPSPAPAPAKRKRVVLDAIELPRRKTSLGVRAMGIRRAASTSGLPPIPVVKRLSRPSRSLSTAMRASSPRSLEDVRVLASDDSVLEPATPGRHAVQVSSSDHDHLLGQVTPHHLVSPAMHRARHFDDSDPPSDEPMSSSSPSRQRAKRMLSTPRRSWAAINTSDSPEVPDPPSNPRRFRLARTASQSRLPDHDSDEEL